jgi:carboxyl-terminal processing protease
MKFKTLFFLFFLSFIFVNAQTFDEHAYKLNKMLGLINNFYVDTVDEPKLVEEAIIAMLKKLDPHSIYISKKEVQRMNEPLQGGFDGIGVQFNIFKDTLMVVGVIAGGPSEKLGIKAGDRIIIIDNDMGIKRLSNIANAFLMHNRDINIRCDDSVVRVLGFHVKEKIKSPGTLYPIRRSRGYAPFPIMLPWEGNEILAAFACS